MGQKRSLLLAIGLLIVGSAPTGGLEPAGPSGPSKHIRKAHDRMARDRSATIRVC
jgi:hypothetical protein